MATEQTEEDDQQNHHGGFDDETMRMLSANLPARIFRSPDPRIEQAALEAERTQQMTPVLKEELRLRILAKRLERGEPDIQTSHTPKTYELTEEEKQKRERRKEQNRRAAKKCREKRKLKNLDVAEVKFDIFREENAKLSQEISAIQRQRGQLMAFLKEHLRAGHCTLPAPQTKAPAGIPKCRPGSNTPRSHGFRFLSQSSPSPTRPPSTPGIPGPAVPMTPTQTDYDHPAAAFHILAPQTSRQATPGNPVMPCQQQQPSTSTTSTFTVAAPTFTMAAPTFTMTAPTFTMAAPTLTMAAPTFTMAAPTFTMAAPTFTVAASSSPAENLPTCTSTQPYYFHLQNHRRLQQHSCHLSCSNPASGTSTNPPATPLPPVTSHPPRPAMSFPPPPSPSSTPHHPPITLTPPPSVSSEQYFVPESPSVLTTLTTTTTSGGPDDLGVHCSPQAVDPHTLTPPILYQQFHTGSGLTYQLSPAESLAGKSPPDFDILNDKMFDDDDDDDDNGRNDFTRILNTLG